MRISVTAWFKNQTGECTGGPEDDLCERTMTTVFTILTLPKTSVGLTALRPTLTTVNLEDDPDRPQKVARSNTDKDSASAFRTKQVSALDEKRKGPIQIQIVGEYSLYFI